MRFEDYCTNDTLHQTLRHQCLSLIGEMAALDQQLASACNDHADLVRQRKAEREGWLTASYKLMVDREAVLHKAWLHLMTTSVRPVMLE